MGSRILAAMPEEGTTEHVDAWLDERFALGAALIEEAAALALGFFERVETLSPRAKGRQDMISEADIATERLIRSRIAKRFPEDAFLGEETGRADVVGARGIWVVDPIDGTQPFLLGLTSWCVSIGFVVGGACEMGFVAAPARDEVFVGRRGHGATLNGRPIHVSGSTSLDNGLVCVGMSPRISADQILACMEPVLRAGAVYYREGSGALSLCYVAAGRLIGYLEPQLNAWDGAGGAAVVEAAGGRVNPWLAGDGLWRGGPIAAAPPGLFPTLLEIAEAAFRA
jgi:myo-inositol-1(or 4)-monophosphatase